MNETYWELEKRAHRKRLLITVLVGFLVLITFGIIICNNSDLLTDRDESTQEFAAADSSSLVFGMADSTEMENFNNADSSPELSVDTHSLKKDKNADLPVNRKVISEIKPQVVSTTTEKINASALKNDNMVARSSQLVKENLITDIPKDKKSDKKLNNIDSSQQYSILLPSIRSSVIDRKDIIISLALELFYRDSTDNGEILIKRDALKIVAIKTIQMKELNSIKKESLSDELKNEMNLIFDRKTLFKVTIREFHIEKVALQ